MRTISSLQPASAENSRKICSRVKKFNIFSDFDDDFISNMSSSLSVNSSRKNLKPKKIITKKHKGYLESANSEVDKKKIVPIRNNNNTVCLNELEQPPTIL